MPAQNQRLSKHEILRGYQAFSKTISSGRSFQRGSLRCFYLARPEDNQNQPQVGFSVTRNVRSAAKRNRLRRWMKESYRLRRSQSEPPAPQKRTRFHVVILFSARGITRLDHQVRDAINKSMTTLLKDLHERLSETT